MCPLQKKLANYECDINFNLITIHAINICLDILTEVKLFPPNYVNFSFVFLASWPSMRDFIF